MVKRLISRTNRMRIVLLLLLLLPQSSGTLLKIVEPVKMIPSVSEIKEFVTLTIYSPTSVQTDSTPHITASGFKIDTLNPGRHKIVAVSRDLKKKGWGFNKKIRIRNAGRYNGVYTIKDVMNKKYKNKIDVLVDSGRKPVKLSNVEITLIK